MRQWVEAALQTRLRSVDPLTGGWTSTMLLVTGVSGDEAVLRLMTREPWRTHACGLLEREAMVLHQLEPTSIPVPRSIALDSTGRVAGAPAHLMSRLPGRLELRRCDDQLLAELAAVLASIHGFQPADDERPRPYQSWAVRAKRVVPAWARRADLWLKAFEVLEAAPPAFVAAFLHRDFHLGNVLWDRGTVSGVVDWVETSWGPPDLDVAHASTYVAMLHGPNAARSFGECYEDLTGRSAAGSSRAYWDLMDIVGYLPGPAKVVQPWRDQGLSIADEVAQRRLEGHLATVLATHDQGG